MISAADMGRHSGRATPSLHDGPYRQFETATGRRSTYPLPNPVQTNPTTSEFKRIAMRACRTDQSFTALNHICSAIINSR